MTGWQTLFYKEVLRFWKVSFQTVAAPVLTAVLYLLIFGHVLQGRVTVFNDGATTIFAIEGGFADVTPDGLTILAEQATEVVA